MRTRPLARIVLLLLTLATVASGGIALGEDPTCGRGTQSGHECAGDNGQAGCKGISRAEDVADDDSQDALDLVQDILNPGNEGDCP